MKMFLGWLRAGAARPFDVFAIDVGRNGDHVTAEILRSADHYEQLAGPVESMAARIRAYGLDAIVFLDVGMGGPVTGVLSAFRLAPVQCATWGHPQTTGSPHVDYFFSSDAMEPADGQDHYTESLVRLPGIGMPYRKPLIPRPVLNPSRSAFGLRDDDVIYLCCQNVSKYLPQRDHVLAEIAAKVPHARFVFIVPNVAIGDALLERMGAPFAAEGLDARDHCVFLGHLDAFRYWELHLCADVFLDSLDWAGCNSSLEAMACGVPIVAFRGPLMRARHTTAFLERIGMGEWVATDADAFVDLAMRLGRDAALRSQVGRSVEHAVGVLCEADRSTEALDDFLVSAIRGRSRGR
jgi:predicted O-linked N-acetylglucosamine transferase (SPINDLY family)